MYQRFQKRHLLAQKMGVIDEDYVQASKDRAAVVGRRIQIKPEEVNRLVEVIRRLGGGLSNRLLPPSPSPPSIQG